MKPVRLAWLATHPIQYQAPILRAITKCPDIDLTALFFSDFSTRTFVDPGFGRTIEWDTPLLEGYRHEFLAGTGRLATTIRTFEPRVKGLAAKLSRDNFDAVLVQGWQHYGMVMGAWLAKRAGLKVLMRCEATDHVAGSTGAKGWVRESVVRFLLNQVDHCMSIGSHNRDFYLKRGVSPGRIGSMPYCVDNLHFRGLAEAADVDALRALFSLQPGRSIILYAGKLMARKFPDHLLAAYRNLSEPRPYLLYVGDGELRASLEKDVQRHGLADVRFLGFKNQSELPGLYALADIFVLPSIGETWGLVVNEAMNAGCAIVTTDQVGSAADLVRTGENGFVIPARDIPALTKALSACMEPERARNMGAESRARIRNWGIDENVAGLREALGMGQAVGARVFLKEMKA